MISNPSSRALIVGAQGQVGCQLLSLLGKGRPVPTSRVAQHREGWLTMDLAALAGRPDVALSLLREKGIEAVYCVGGMTDVEACESSRDLAMQTNCAGPSALAEAAEVHRIPIVYFSTEYVFDGTAGPYLENAQGNPLCVYGESKWLGEQGMIQANSRALVIRTTVVYGPDARGKNFLYSLRRAHQERRPFRVPNDQISTPTFNMDLAAATVFMLERGFTGIYHVCGPEVISRLEFALRAAAAMGLDPSNVVGIPTSELDQRARRPLRAGLLTEKLVQDCRSIQMRGIEESISCWLHLDGHSRGTG